MNDKERLERFEEAFKELTDNYEKLAKELDILRNEGKMKSVKFREALGRKLILSNAISIFESHGITKLTK